MIAHFLQQWRDAWNRFWFRPADPLVLGVLRVLVGSMLFYSHLVWTLDLETKTRIDICKPSHSYKEKGLHKGNICYEKALWGTQREHAPTSDLNSTDALSKWTPHKMNT